MKKRGVFTLTEERIAEVTNHISEGIHSAYTKKEAAECVQYWAMDAYYKQQELQSKRGSAFLANFKAMLDKIEVPPQIRSEM